MLLWPCTYLTQISLYIYIIYLLHFLFTLFNVNEISTIHFTPFSLLFYRYTVKIWLSKISCIKYGFNVNNYTSCTSRTCIIIHIMIDRPRSTPHYRRLRSISSTIFMSLCLDFLLIWSTEFIKASNCLFEYSCKTDNVIYRLNVLNVKILNHALMLIQYTSSMTYNVHGNVTYI